MASTKQHKVFYGSSYDRGLDYLLFMWPDVIKKYPDAELHICYGWEMFDKVASNNPERMQWKESMMSMMRQNGVYHHGRVGQDELTKIRQSCGIWAYPTDFPEIFCITAVQSQHDGLVPVTMDYAALSETVGSGVKIEGNIKERDTQNKFLDALIDIMGDKTNWEKESKKAKKHAKGFEWARKAKDWSDVFEQKTKKPLVSVITITIREGFWNLMAENIASQTYKNLEWVIIDDHKEDRSEVARKYAQKYNLNIRYIRGDKALGKHNRRYGLVRANNKGWSNAKGELLVWLQDFILMPHRGIEDLVNIYNHNPNSLIAPTDDYWNSIDINKSNKEDWFNGETDVLTSHSWTNVRNTYEGIRLTDDPFDFEMNWSATPRHIIEELNGWWEWMDDGLGYDNTEIAYRALKKGYTIIIDDANKAKCINLWPHIGGTAENILERERHLSVPYWEWLRRKVDSGKMPIVRDESVDSQISLEFKVPDDIPDEKCSEWITGNTYKIVDEWEKNEKA